MNMNMTTGADGRGRGRDGTERDGTDADGVRVRGAAGVLAPHRTTSVTHVLRLMSAELGIF